MRHIKSVIKKFIKKLIVVIGSSIFIYFILLANFNMAQAGVNQISQISQSNQSYHSSNASVEKVIFKQSPLKNQYDVSVTIKSSDKDCSYYVNFWEVVAENGKIIQRRVLFHPHTAEQPFTRSARVKIQEKRKVYIRAHFFPIGYSSEAIFGSIKTGFKKVILPNKLLNKKEVTLTSCYNL